MRIKQVEAHRDEAPKLRVGLVQGNISFDKKGLNHQNLAAEQLADLQAESAKLEGQGAELIVWSESSYPYRIPRDAKADPPLENPYRVRSGFTAPLIFGA